MKAYGRSEFADRFAEVAADGDYSRHPKLQSASQYDVRAAAEALWTYAMRNNVNLDQVTLDEEIVVTAMLAQERRWDDEGELVSTEFEQYWDLTDRMNFSSGLLEEMKKELVYKYLDIERTDHVIVSNRDGIWLFRKDGIWSGREGA